MAYGRYRKKRRRSKKKNDVTLLFTSKVRRNSMLVGLAISPLVIGGTDIGKRYATWVATKFNELRGRV